MTITELYAWIEDNPFVTSAQCGCDYYTKRNEVFGGTDEKCMHCAHDNPHPIDEQKYTAYRYCTAPITVRMTGSEVKETILKYIQNEKST